LKIVYAVEGNLESLRIPARREPRVAERLWQHTCCEMFVARKGAAAYLEFNFSPSGEWAAYAFTGYRAGRRLCGEEFAPRISALQAGSRLVLECSVPFSGEDLVLGLSAVMEAADGGLSYWALKHPPGKPDFHHRDAFALELA
jgi:hypothetical protein